MTSADLRSSAGQRSITTASLRYALPLALLAVFGFFSWMSPNFLSAANLESVLVNNFTLLAIVAIALTLVVTAGGIDLSVGAAIDFSSLAFVTLVLSGTPVWLAALAGLAAGTAVGAINAVLIAGLRIAPFLATLGTLFIARSAQQLLTGGGNPIYLPASATPESFLFLGHGRVLGLPAPLIVAIVLLVAIGIVLRRTGFGRVISAIGIQPGVAWYSGLAVPRATALVYIACAFVCAIAGLLLSSTVSVYVPYSGNAFLLNAVGATFIGTTLSPARRPNIPGTALGVLLLSFVANGLLLIGQNFYWQQVGTGALIFAVLAISFAGRKG